MKLQLLNDMMIFVKVMENQSFTGAGRELGISKSVVSKYVSRLEKNLNAQLLQRSTRQLSPTEAGRALYERVASICEDLEQAELAVSYVHSAPRGTLHVASPNSFNTLHLTSAIAEFMRQYPEIKIQLQRRISITEMMASGIDVAIHIGDLPDSNLVARKLTTRSMRVCASPEYLEKHGTPKTPEELLQHNCLLYMQLGIGNEWRFEKDKQELNVKVNGSMKVDSGNALVAAAVSGIGIVKLPGYLMTNEIKQGKLVSLLEEFTPPSLTIYAVYPHTKHLAPKVRAFIDFLVERFSDEEYWI